MTKYLTKLIINLKFYSHPSILQGALMGLAWEAILYDFKESLT